MQIYNQIRVVLLSSCWSGDQQQLKKSDYLHGDKEIKMTNNNRVRPMV